MVHINLLHQPIVFSYYTELNIALDYLLHYEANGCINDENNEILCNNSLGFLQFLVKTLDFQDLSKLAPAYMCLAILRSIIVQNVALRILFFLISGFTPIIKQWFLPTFTILTEDFESE